jgi:ssDNA-binding Zn-finger/Zn-ribbon topoisomerase 1
MSSIPREKDIEAIYQSESACIDFLIEQKVLYNYEECPKCKKGIMRRYKSKPKLWMCNNYKCKSKISVFKDSFFANNKIPCHDLLRIAYKWLSGQRFKDIVTQTGHAQVTVCDHIRFCREIIASFVYEEDTKIGGPGIIVEVDESKFGKVKYHRGHRVEGVWILGGVERTEERRIFLVAVPDRTKETLVNILERHILPGSVVITDLWKGYTNLSECLEVEHKTVNHTTCFKDPETGAHSNTIEGTWAGVKFKVAPRNRTEQLIDLHLAEFIWRRQNANNLWNAFIGCLNDTMYTINQ